jgi:ribosomal-protein-alanine N-acetyltransferase
VRPDAFFTVEGQREWIASHERHNFLILDSAEPAGVISLSHLVRGRLQCANVGYWVDEKRNGRGLATAAVGEVVKYAFGELQLHRLEAGTLVDNVASQRVLEKNAFERFGLARRYLLIAGDWYDHVLFERVAD